MLREAIAKQKSLQEVKTAADNYLKKRKNVAQWPTKQLEPELVRAIVDYRSRLHKEDDWLLSRTGMREVASDFNLIHDYASQTKDLDAQLEVYGSLFLTHAQSVGIQKQKRRRAQSLSGEPCGRQAGGSMVFRRFIVSSAANERLSTNTRRGVLAWGG